MKTNIASLASLIWSVADLLRGDFKQSQYGRIILPFTVLRRLECVLGAATAMKAGTAWLPWKKMGFAEDGLAQLDKALALLTPAHNAPVQNGTPGVLEVKFVAANTFLAVPGFMHRQERGTKLLGEVLSSPLLANAPLGFRGTVWLKAAQEATKTKNTTEARRCLDLILQHQAPQAAQAQALLKGLTS